MALVVLLAGSLFGVGCKQGIGDRCEVASDCETNYCSPGSSSQNGICCDPNNTQTCVVQGGAAGSVGTTGGSGGATGQGGDTGQGGASGQGGAGDATSDASTDGADDASGTD